LDVLIQEWLLDDDIAPALLNYLRDLSSGKALDEQQVVVNEESGADGRHFLWTFHTDGFAPLATSPNTFSMTYGILKAMLGSAMSHLRSACKIWFLTNGPGHNKSTSWFDHILEAQIREVVFRGVMCRWRHRMVLPAAGTIYCKCLGTEASCTCTVAYEPGEFRCHGIIALAAADQPATQVSTGRINHNAAQACRYPHVHTLHKHMDMAALSLVYHDWFRLVSPSRNRFITKTLLNWFCRVPAGVNQFSGCTLVPFHALVFDDLNACLIPMSHMTEAPQQKGLLATMPPCTCTERMCLAASPHVPAKRSRMPRPRQNSRKNPP
jgi:hypothetical protein